MLETGEMILEPVYEELLHFLLDGLRNGGKSGKSGGFLISAGIGSRILFIPLMKISKFMKIGS